VCVGTDLTHVLVALAFFFPTATLNPGVCVCVCVRVCVYVCMCESVCVGTDLTHVLVASSPLQL